MREQRPTFPPLLKGHSLTADIAPAKWAKSRAAKGKLGAGDLAWSENMDDLRFALVLEPDVPRARCPEIAFAAMVAIGDAIGALSPPELAISYRWPSMIFANDAEIGFVDLEISEKDHERVPEWMVLSADLWLRPRRDGTEPGADMSKTTLWDEGCVGLSRTQLLEAASRHIVNLTHSWSEDGFRPVHSQWWERLSEKCGLAAGAIADDEGASLLGLDETGNAIIKTAAGTQAVPAVEALDRLRAQRGEAL